MCVCVVCRPVYLHHLPQLLQQLGLDPDVAEPQGSHILVSTLVLLAPGFHALGAHGLYVLTDAVSAALSGKHCPQPVSALRTAASFSAVSYTCLRMGIQPKPALTPARRVLNLWPLSLCADQSSGSRTDCVPFPSPSRLRTMKST